MVCRLVDCGAGGLCGDNSLALQLTLLFGDTPAAFVGTELRAAALAHLDAALESTPAGAAWVAHLRQTLAATGNERLTARHAPITSLEGDCTTIGRVISSELEGTSFADFEKQQLNK